MNQLGPASLPALSRGLVRVTSPTRLSTSSNDLLAEGLRASPLLAKLEISGSAYPLGRAAVSGVRAAAGPDPPLCTGP